LGGLSRRVCRFYAGRLLYSIVSFGVFFTWNSFPPCPFSPFFSTLPLVVFPPLPGKPFLINRVSLFSPGETVDRYPFFSGHFREITVFCPLYRFSIGCVFSKFNAARELPVITQTGLKPDICAQPAFHKNLRFLSLRKPWPPQSELCSPSDVLHSMLPSFFSDVPLK